ncbi:MAG: zincin-like metallopeptidase domain-containing protein [Planctomycetota bacterium]
MASKSKPRRDIYQEVTDRVLEILRRGTVPWHNPIRPRNGGDGWPKNLASSKRYRGINIFLLAFMTWHAGYGSDYWVTFKQAQELGGNVIKGEKSSLVTFWKLYEKTDIETGEEVTLPCLKHYNVFNVEQCEGLPIPDTMEFEPLEFSPIAAAERIMAGYPNSPTIKIAGNKASYSPSSDTIQIAPAEQFASRESYYATLFHEAVHSTGHELRLNRGIDALSPFGSPDYGKEELVAEMGAAFLNATAGIIDPTLEQSAAYIEHWQKKIRADKRLVVSAAANAQKAADHILGTTWHDQEPSPKRT